MNPHTLLPLVEEPAPPSVWLQRPLLVSWGLVLLSALTVALGACASAPMPTDQIAVTTAAIAHAEAAEVQAASQALREEMGRKAP